MKVLVVEDDPVQRDCLEEFLRQRGCWTDSMATVTGAIMRLKVSVPDIVVADYVLIDHTAVDFIAKMRKLPRCHVLPILVISGIRGPECDALLKLVEESPPAKLMTKPFEMLDLFKTMCEMTDRCELYEYASKSCS